MGELKKAAEKKDIPRGKALAVEIDGRRIALFNVNDQIFAIDDTCTHADGPLSEGEVEGTKVTCPWHGAQFDLVSGEVLSAPAFEGVKTYKVQIEGEEIKVEI